MIKVIIFDYFGVFAEPGSFDFLIKDYAKKFDVNKNDFFDVRRKLWDKARVSKITEEQFWVLLVEKMRINIMPTEMRREWYSSFKPISGTFDLAMKLKKKYKIALISNTIPDWFTFWKEKYSLEKVFDYIFVSYEMKVAKPNKDIYIRALQKMNVEPKECVFIDDKEENVRSAEKLGIYAIQFMNPKQLEKDLKILGVEL